MPLEWGRIIGYDAGRMTFEFTMIDRALVAVIECEISAAAMDQLAGTKGTLPVEREPQFMRLRNAIERIASDLFDEGMPTPNRVIRIFFTMLGSPNARACLRSAISAWENWDL
jgi:hypothetical protein